MVALLAHAHGVQSSRKLSARGSGRFDRLKHAHPATMEQLESRVMLSTTYYVDSSAGSDSNTGLSTGQAWQHLSKVAGFTFSSSGDTVLLNGTFANQPMTLGSKATNLTVDSYPGTMATLNGLTGNGIVVNTSGVTLKDLTVTAAASNPQGFGIMFNNTGTTTLNGAAVNNVNVSGFGWYGIWICGSNSTTCAGYSNVTISNSSFNYNQVSGIVVGINSSSVNPDTNTINSNITITGCITHDNTGLNVATGSGYAFNGGIFISSVNGCTVTHCVAYHNCFDTGGGVGIWAFDSTNVLFAYNESYNNAITHVSGSTDGDGFDFDRGVTNSTMMYNYSHDNDGAGYLLCTVNEGSGDPTGSTNNGNTVAYNISWNDGRWCDGSNNTTAGLVVYAAPSYPVLNANLFNNTIHEGPGTISGSPLAVRVWGSSAGTSTARFMNNIFYVTGTEAIVSAPAKPTYLYFEGNDYWAPSAGTQFNVSWGGTTYTSLSSWRAAASGEEMNGSNPIGLNVNPTLRNDTVDNITLASDPGLTEFKLALNSGVRDMAQNLTAAPYTSAPYNLTSAIVGASDLWGNALDQGSGYDIGANEAIPSPWLEEDIGAVGSMGNASLSPDVSDASSNTFTVNGSGSDIYGTADAFHYVYRTINGDGTVSTKVLAQGNTNASAKAGLMFRDTAAAGAMFADVVVTPSSGIEFQYRSSTNGSAAQSGSSVTGVTAPVWLKLMRNGNNFSAYYSTDNVTWSQVGSTQTIAMGSNALVGLADTAHDGSTNSTALSTDTFNSLSLALINAPSGLSATTISGTQINLAWTDNSSNETGFKIERATNSTFTQNDTLVTTTAANATSYSDTGLSGTTLYYYRVRATNASGDSTNSNTASATTLTNIPAVPTGLATTPVSRTQINLTWNTSSGATSYSVERANNSGMTGATVLTSTDGTNSYSDSSASAGTTYYYAVAANSSGGSSAYCSSVSGLTLPAVPGSLSATAINDAQINLAWSDSDPVAPSYTVIRSTASNMSGATTLTTTDSSTSFSDQTVSGGTTYYYEVQATNASGASGYQSTPANATTPANRLSNLVEANAAAPGLIQGSLHIGSLRFVDRSYTYTSLLSSGSTFNFTGADYLELANNDKTVSNYAVSYTLSQPSFVFLINGSGQALPTSGANWFVNTNETVPGSPTMSIYEAPEAAGTYTLGAEVSGGNFYSVFVMGTPPATPSGLSANAISSSQINLSWTNNATGQTGFTIERATDSLFTQNVTQFTTNATTYSDTSVSPTTTYYYEVEVNTTAGASLFSPSANATTPALIPPVPTGLATTVASSTQINLSWNTSSGAASYDVERALNSAMTGATVLTTTDSSTSYNDTTASAGTTYYYAVAANSSGGSSAYSSSVSGLTQPSVPAALATAVISSSQINLSWTDADPIAPTYSVERALNSAMTGATVLTTTDSSSSYSDTTVSAGTTYYYAVQATNGSGTSAWTSPASGTTPGSTSGLFGSDLDIGSPSPAGSGSYNSSTATYSVAGGGADIWGTSDQFNYYSTALSTDGSIVAQVTGVSNPNSWAQAGVMIRNDTTASAAFGEVSLTPTNGVTFRYRATAGASVSQTSVAGLSAPVWVKLTRGGSSFSAYYSSDGNSWTQIGATQTLTLAATATAGLCVTSHSNGTLCTATFTNVDIATGLFATDQDIGNPTLAGSANFVASTGVYTVAASGSDIWGTSDQFNYLSQAYSGNGTIVADVTGISSTNTYSKAGVMFRDTTNSNAMFADVVVSAAQGIMFQYRTSTGGTCGSVAGAALNAPVWLELTRSGNNFSAYYSTDGATWTQIGSTQTIAMGTNATNGLAVVSKSNSVLATATFASVSILGGNFTNDLDIGAPSPAGYANYNPANGSYTVAGSGGDIWGTSDQFNYLSHSISGDSSISAQVTSIANTNSMAQAGVMYRNDNSAGSMFAEMAVTPSGGLTFRYRSSTGGSVSQVTVSGITAPVYVKITRSGNNFSAYYSTNGTTWIQVGTTQTIAMNTTILGGLSVTAHNNGALDLATFNNVVA